MNVTVTVCYVAISPRVHWLCMWVCMRSHVGTWSIMHRVYHLTRFRIQILFSLPHSNEQISRLVKQHNGFYKTARELNERNLHERWQIKRSGSKWIGKMGITMSVPCTCNPFSDGIYLRYKFHGKIYLSYRARASESNTIWECWFG